MSIYVYSIRVEKVPCNPVVTKEYIKILAVLSNGDTINANLTYNESIELHKLLSREIKRKA